MNQPKKLNKVLTEMLSGYGVNYLCVHYKIGTKKIKRTIAIELLAEFLNQLEANKVEVIDITEEE